MDGGDSWTQLAATADDASFWAVNRVAMSANGKTLLAATAAASTAARTAARRSRAIASGIPAQDVQFHPTTAAMRSRPDGAASPSRETAARPGVRPLVFPPTAAAGSKSRTRRRHRAWCTPRSTRRRIAVPQQRRRCHVRPVATRDLLDNQGWYNNAIWVNPDNSNDLIVGGALLRHSLDGGLTWQELTGLHVDNHAIVAQPGYDDAGHRTVFVANDGGIYRTADIRPASGAPPTFEALNNNLGVTQFYGGAGHSQHRRDRRRSAGQRHARCTVPRPGAYWTQTLGSDGGQHGGSDPVDSSRFYSETIYLSLFRSTKRRRRLRADLQRHRRCGREREFHRAVRARSERSECDARRRRELVAHEERESGGAAWSAITGPGAPTTSARSRWRPGNSDIVWVGRSYGRVYRAANGAAVDADVSVARPRRRTAISSPSITISPFDANVVYVTTGSFGLQTSSRRSTAARHGPTRPARVTRRCRRRPCTASRSIRCGPTRFTPRPRSACS